MTKLSNPLVELIASIACIGLIAAVGLSSCSPAQAPTPEALSASSSSTPQLNSVPRGVGPLDQSQLMPIGKAAFAFVAKDEYSKGFDDTALVGRPFDFKFVGDNLSHYYDANSEVLRVTIDPAGDSFEPKVHQAPEHFLFLDSKEDRIDSPTEKLTTLGVKATVSPSIEFSVGIGAVAGEIMGAIPFDRDPQDDDAIGYGMITKTMKMSPDNARLAMSNVWMEAEGVFVKSKKGTVVSCSTFDADLEPDDKFLFEHTKCIFSVKLKRVRVLSKDLGVIAEWPHGAEDKITGKYEND